MIQTLCSCSKCGAKTSLRGLAKDNGGYRIFCTSCLSLTQLPEICGECDSNDVQIKRSGPQYRMFCRTCKNTSALFYDCHTVTTAFLKRIC